MIRNQCVPVTRTVNPGNTMVLIVRYSIRGVPIKMRIQRRGSIK